MADHSLPTTASTYTNFVTELDQRFDDLALGLDPAFTSATSIPDKALRFSSSAGKWQRWDGGAWVDAAATYAISISGNAGTVTNGVYTSGTYADPAWITSLAGSKITGNISGNAGTATTLATARTINGVSFNGSANISVNTVNSITFNNAGTGASSGATFNGGSAATVSYNTIGAAASNGANASGTWNINISGNAATATTLSATLAVNRGGTGLASAGTAGHVLRSDGTGFYTSPVSAATGGGLDEVFLETGQTVTTSYTITTGRNAVTPGPITIADGATVTIPADSNWVIV